MPVAVTKFVGVASSVDTDRSLTAASPQAAAAAAAARAAKAGYQSVLTGNAGAWSRLWQSSISIPGDTATNAQIRASMFYLLASTRAGVDWSISPGGLSSDGYDGHVFWDMETWMYPALLAQYPDIAAGANTYRQKRLPAAQAAASQLSALRGREVPLAERADREGDHPSWWPDGNQEIHIDSDIALAQWQYYQATGRHGVAQGQGVAGALRDRRLLGRPGRTRRLGHATTTSTTSKDRTSTTTTSTTA